MLFGVTKSAFFTKLFKEVLYKLRFRDIYANLFLSDQLSTGFPRVLQRSYFARYSTEKKTKSNTVKLYEEISLER